MSPVTRRPRAFVLVLAAAAVLACDAPATAPTATHEAPSIASLASAGPATSFAVSGTSVHHVSTGIVHAQEPTATGYVQRATEVVRLSGDLDGWVLYHPTSVFDFDAGTLVNTGTQIFSGTVAGSGPLLLHDDTFRFEVDLATGATVGEVHLGRNQDAPRTGHWYACDLEVVDTGQSPEGDYLGAYTGTCTRYGHAG